MNENASQKNKCFAKYVKTGFENLKKLHDYKTWIIAVVFYHWYWVGAAVGREKRGSVGVFWLL